MNYIFENELIEGIIVKKNSQYTMTVSIYGEDYKCYYPCDAKLNISFKGTPCLVSVSKSLSRNTSYTVEALWIHDKWVGINPKLSKKCVELLNIEDAKVEMHTAFDSSLLKSRKTEELFLSEIERLSSNQERIIYLNLYQYQYDFKEMKWSEEQNYRFEEALLKGVEVWEASFVFEKDSIFFYKLKKIVL